MSLNQASKELLNRKHIAATHKSSADSKRHVFPSEWRMVALGDLFKVKHGYAFKGENFSDVPQKTVLVTPGNFAIGGGFQEGKLKYYHGPVPKDYQLKAGQVVVTMTDLSKASDTLGYAALIPKDSNVWLHNQRIGLLVFCQTEPSDPRFIQYLLRSQEYRSWIIGSATGTTVKHTSPGRIKSFCTTIPALPEQRRIASILGNLDDQIENNRKLAKTLEDMAQAIFLSWFVDFDPVRAKMAGESRESICQRLKITPEILDLFPDRLVDSELGEIPEGWEVKLIGDIAEKRNQSILPSNISSDTAYIALEHMPRKCIALSERGSTNGIESSKLLFKKGDILFGKLRPYFHKIGVAPVDGVCSTDMVVIAPRVYDYYGFLLFHLSSDKYIAYVSSRATGTKMPRTTWSDMASYKIAVPQKDICSNFTSTVTSAIDIISSSISKNISIANLRDFILPNIISDKTALHLLVEGFI